MAVIITVSSSFCSTTPFVVHCPNQPLSLIESPLSIWLARDLTDEFITFIPSTSSTICMLLYDLANGPLDILAVVILATSPIE